MSITARRKTSLDKLGQLMVHIDIDLGGRTEHIVAALDRPSYAQLCHQVANDPYGGYTAVCHPATLVIPPGVLIYNVRLSKQSIYAVFYPGET
jgi:hypothetical protein